MRTARIILQYILAALVVLILGALAGWYFFLRAQTSTTAAVDTARGLGSDSPSFSGSLGSTASNTGGAVSGTSGAVSSGPVARLWAVDHAPVAGMAFAPTTATATSTQLYFAERASGYIFDADPGTGSVKRLTNTLMPKIYEALFAPGKRGVLLRTQDANGAITTFAGTFASSTTSALGGASAASSVSQALFGYYLPKDIRRVAIDEKSGALFYLTPSASGIVGTTLQWDGSKKKQVFTSIIASWRPISVGSQLMLLENPADDTPGYAYTLNTAGGLVPLIGPAPGLDIAPHPSENAFLFSSSSGGVLTLFAQVGKSAAVRLALQTTASKCVWLSDKSFTAYCAVPASIPSQHYLDNWYQGALHTADTWWQVNASDGTVKLLFAPQQALDVQKPTIDPSGTYIAFVNGSDQSLWMLRIAQ